MQGATPKPVRLGAIELWPPIVLAPMAGVTDYPFRGLCRSFATKGFNGLGACGAPKRSGEVPREERRPEAEHRKRRRPEDSLGEARGPGHTPGLFVSEMITARPLVEGERKTSRLASFGPDEWPRSLQLYGVDAYHVGEAVKRLVAEDRIDHLDMNFGCPVPKVTRRGGGAAIPAKPRLLAKIVRAAVRAAGEIPVTIKFRKGIDAGLITFRDAGRIAQEEGCAAVGLHARTAEQFYEDGADWDAIAELVSLVDIPVFGNGDIWEAHDAARMLRETGCAGVIIGRGCLGRPWLFAELVALLGGGAPSPAPAFGQVARIMREHAAAMVSWCTRNHDAGRGGASPEQLALSAFRKHASWYTKGFRGSASLRERLMHVEDLQTLEVLLAGCDPDEPFPDQALRAVRGKRGRQRRVALPAGFRDQLDDDRAPGPEAEMFSSGG